MLSIILKYWMELLMTTLVSAIIYVFKQYCSLKGGMRSLLRMEIVRIYETYMNLGYCPSYMKENISELYESYHILIGDGMATSMINEIYKLPVKGRGV